MSDSVTKFPPQTYSSSFYLNSIAEGGKNTVVSDPGKEIEESPALDCFISSMKSLPILVILLASQITGQLRECILEREPKIRTFNTIDDYQGNKYCFNPDIVNEYSGNYIQFSFRSISKLPRNVFVSYCSEAILKIDLSSKNITLIDDEAFTSLFCLHFLDLSSNLISRLQKGVFKGLDNLRELNLSNNHLETLYGMTFAHLERLEDLDLSNNNIRIISPFAFGKLYSLKTLDLNRNSLRNFDFDTLRDANKTLEVLDLANNALAVLNFGAKMDKLIFLNLSSNHLVDLNVHNTSLTLISLNEIDISGNKYSREHLSKLLRQFTVSNITVFPNNLNYLLGVNSRDIYAEGTTAQVNVSPDKSLNLSELLKHSEEILKRTKDVKVNVNNLEILVFYLVIVLAIFFAFDVLLRTGAIQSLWVGFRRKSNMYYIDSNNVEHISLIRRRYEDIA